MFKLYYIAVFTLQWFICYSTVQSKVLLTVFVWMVKPYEIFVWTAKFEPHILVFVVKQRKQQTEN